VTGCRSPWLSIPVGDYEAHMDRTGQTQALRDIFGRAHREARPKRLLVLGCSTGGDLLLVDPAITRECVGVDLNPEAIAEAERRGVDRAVPGCRLMAGDVLEVDLPEAAFDLVYVALLFEYVDAARLFGRIVAWLDPAGRCVVVTQSPVEGVPAVSSTGYDSLQVLETEMTLRNPAEMEAMARGAGLVRTGVRDVPLRFGKHFAVAEFERAGSSPAPVPRAPAGP